MSSKTQERLLYLISPIGLIALWQAVGAGVPTYEISNRRKRGELIVVHPGVYRLRGAPFTQELRWLATLGRLRKKTCRCAARELSPAEVARWEACRCIARATFVCGPPDPLQGT